MLVLWFAPPSLISAFDKLRSAKSDGWVLATLDNLALVHVSTALKSDADSLRDLNDLPERQEIEYCCYELRRWDGELAFAHLNLEIPVEPVTNSS